MQSKTKLGRIQKFWRFLPLKEISVFVAPLLDQSVSTRSILEKSNFLKFLVFFWIFVSILLSNLYRGIVVENIVAPTNFIYPQIFDDLKFHSFKIFAIKSFDWSDLLVSKSAFFQHLVTCDQNLEHCKNYYNLSDEMSGKKFLNIFTKMWSNRSHSVVKDKVSDFERQILDVFRANIRLVYEKYVDDKLTFEQAETEGRKLISGYLYEQTQSLEPNNLNDAFDEIMACKSTVFVGLIEHLKEIEHRLPPRSIKTGQ